MLAEAALVIEQEFVGDMGAEQRRLQGVEELLAAHEVDGALQALGRRCRPRAPTLAAERTVRGLRLSGSCRASARTIEAFVAVLQLRDASAGRSACVRAPVSWRSSWKSAVANGIRRQR